MNKIRSFMRDKGFYIALVACILIAGVSSFLAIRNMMHRLDGENQPPQGYQEEIPWEAPQIGVEQKSHDVPVQPKPSAQPQPQQPLPSGQQPQPQPEQDSGDAAAQAGASCVPPVSGKICAEYSGDELVYNETLKDWRTHNGVDIACGQEEAVKACQAGKVTAVYEDGSWGHVVEVEGSGVVLRYAGLGKTKVKAGDTVSAGDKLGVIGEVGCGSASGPHLHLEALKGGVYTDPQEYLG